MDCLHPDHPARRVTLKFSAQTGKSEVGVNWFAFIVDQAPGPMLTVLPTGDEATKYNRVKLQPTIDASPRIRHKVRNTNSRDETASTARKGRAGFRRKPAVAIGPFGDGEFLLWDSRLRERSKE
jgi:phage terminase large subunit GpA-like protein